MNLISWQSSCVSQWYIAHDKNEESKGGKGLLFKYCPLLKRNYSEIVITKFTYQYTNNYKTVFLMLGNCQDNRFLLACCHEARKQNPASFLMFFKIVIVFQTVQFLYNFLSYMHRFVVNNLLKKKNLLTVSLAKCMARNSWTWLVNSVGVPVSEYDTGTDTGLTIYMWEI